MWIISHLFAFCATVGVYLLNVLVTDMHNYILESGLRIRLSKEITWQGMYVLEPT